MKPCSRRLISVRGATLLELLFVVLIISIMALLILPVIAKAKASARRAACVNNLHQLGIAHHMFAHDHGDKFPFQVATNEGGTLEFARASFAMSGEFYFAFRHFQVLSNALIFPRVLTCPADTRTNADHFAILRNHNMSYFVGVNADYTHPASLLAGDRNLTGDGLVTGSILRLSPSGRAEWTSASHMFQGNLLFADGHVGQENNEGLASAVNSSGTQISQLLPPVVPPAGSEITVAAEPMVVASLQRFFDSGIGTQNGGEANPETTPEKLPQPAASANATRAPTAQQVARPASGTSKPTPPAPAMAASRPAPNVDDIMATNPALAVAAQDAAAVGHTGMPAKVPSGTPGSRVSAPDQFNFYFLLFQPGSHFWSWLLLLLLTLVAAFFLGWHLYRSRARRPPAAIGAACRGG